ncbi:hypothetical protein BDZ89DRAFT_1045400 [Hymenopellis radicata]|nr:hypothetical protein BDZ89DRAFT_1045400 [Hymenopellis radicata]
MPSIARHTTFAQRNPHKDIILLVPKEDRHKASTAKDATLRQDRADKAKLLDNAIKLFLLESDAKMRALSKEHSVNSFKKERAPSLANAITHARAQQLNKDLPKGERLDIDKLMKKIGEEEATWVNLTQSEKDELIDNLVAFEPSRRLARAQTIERQLWIAWLRSGTFKQRRLALFAGANANDGFVPTIVETKNASKFIEIILGYSIPEMLEWFKDYATLCSSTALGTNESRAAMRTALSNMIHQGLARATNKPTVKMSYAGYDIDVVSKYRFRLTGWPKDIAFCAPANMSLQELRRMVDLWQGGVCRWVAMSKKDIEAHDAEVAQRVKDGELKRQRRQARTRRKDQENDTGPDDLDGDEEDAAPKPKKRAKRRTAAEMKADKEARRLAAEKKKADKQAERAKLKAAVKAGMFLTHTPPNADPAEFRWVIGPWIPVNWQSLDSCGLNAGRPLEVSAQARYLLLAHVSTGLKIPPSPGLANSSTQPNKRPWSPSPSSTPTWLPPPPTAIVLVQYPTSIFAAVQLYAVRKDDTHLWFPSSALVPARCNFFVVLPSKLLILRMETATAQEHPDLPSNPVTVGAAISFAPTITLDKANEAPEGQGDVQHIPEAGNSEGQS